VCIVVVILCAFVVLCVCIVVFFCTSDAGLLARSQYSEGPATGNLDTANAETVPNIPSCHYMLLM